MEGAGAHLHVVGLQDDAAVVRPIALQRQDQALERALGAHVGGQIGHADQRNPRKRMGADPIGGVRGSRRQAGAANRRRSMSTKSRAVAKASIAIFATRERAGPPSDERWDTIGGSHDHAVAASRRSSSSSSLIAAFGHVLLLQALFTLITRPRRAAPAPAANAVTSRASRRCRIAAQRRQRLAGDRIDRGRVTRRAPR